MPYMFLGTVSAEEHPSREMNEMKIAADENKCGRALVPSGSLGKLWRQTASLADFPYTQNIFL